jgi:peptide/nickel transport system substrate-binding protein
VVVVTAAEPNTLFPPLAASDVSLGLVDLIFAKLADVGPELSTVGDSLFVPVLAESWRWDDSLTLRFRIRPGARWHDGTPVSAEDVAFSFGVYRDPAVNSPARQRLAAIETVTTAAGAALFRFRRAYAEQFFDAVYHMRILPRHLWDSVPPSRMGAHRLAREPVGSGPFRLMRWEPGQHVALVADPAFVLGAPGLARVVWQFVPDPVAAVTRLLAGEADVMPALGSPDNIQRVAADSGLRIVEYPLAVYGFLGFNLREASGGSRSHPLFGDAALRRALAMAVDRRALVEAVLGRYGQVPPAPVGPALWVAGVADAGQAFDPAAARRSLEELGWRDADGDGVLERGGRRLEFRLLVPSSSGLRRRAAVILQEQLRRTGVSVRLDELEFNTFMERAAAHRFDAYFGMWAQDPSPASIKDTWTSSGLSGQNFGGYSNPAFDSLVDRALASPDLGHARARWREALALINRDAPGLWLLAPVGVAGVHRRFENVSIRPDQWTASLWRWTLEPSRALARDSAAAR